MSSVQKLLQNSEYRYLLTTVHFLSEFSDFSRKDLLFMGPHQMIIYGSTLERVSDKIESRAEGFSLWPDPSIYKIFSARGHSV